jgi:hypothetical protein
MGNDYTQLGISGLALGIIFFIVRYFVAAMKSKDNLIIDSMRKVYDISSQFNKTISNHIVHEQAAKESLTDTLDRLNTTMAKLPQQTVELLEDKYNLIKK